MARKPEKPERQVRSIRGAEALIADASRRTTTTPAPSAEALAELRKLCAHNDQQLVQSHKVGAVEAIEMLRGYGWAGSSRTALNAICRHSLGRRTYGTP